MESVKQEDIIPPEHRGRMSTAVQSVPSLHAEDYEDEGRILEQANAGFWPALGYWTSPPWPEEKQRVREMYYTGVPALIWLRTQCMAQGTKRHWSCKRLLR